MSYLYVSEQGATINFEANRFQVRYKDGLVKSIPAETLEIIEVFGSIQITTQCLQECLKRGINVLYYSSNGSYFGRLTSTNHVNVHRQRLQATLSIDEEFKRAFSKKIILAKINNQIVVLRRYSRGRDVDVTQEITEMRYAMHKISSLADLDISAIMGYEGTAAKSYFKAMGKLIDTKFRFSGRTRRPPTDPFNSLISLGYSIIMNEIYGKLEGKGLNPYFGFMHADREKHPTLASDLVEEWRAVLIDSLAMSLLNGHELNEEDFYTSLDEPGVFLTNSGFKVFIAKLENKLRSNQKYLEYVGYETTFRRAIDLQVNQLVKAIETGNPEEYQPIRIR